MRHIFLIVMAVIAVFGAIDIINTLSTASAMLTTYDEGTGLMSFLWDQGHIAAVAQSAAKYLFYLVTTFWFWWFVGENE